MPKITSDVSNTNPFSAIPDGWYTMRVTGNTFGTSKTREDGTGGNPMLTLGFTVEQNVEAPQYNNRQVNFYNVTVGGKDKNGAPQNLNRVFELIAATGVSWDHESCGAIGMTKSPIEDRKNGKWICPECNEALGKVGSTVSYNSDDFSNKHVRALVATRKRLGTDEDQNEIRRVRALA